MSKLTSGWHSVTGRLAGNWRGDRETLAAEWGDRGHHVREGRQRGFRRGEGDRARKAEKASRSGRMPPTPKRSKARFEKTVATFGPAPMCS